MNVEKSNPAKSFRQTSKLMNLAFHRFEFLNMMSFPYSQSSQIQRCKMQSIRSVTCSRLLRRRRHRVVFTQQSEEALEQSTSRHNKRHVPRRLYRRNDSNCKPWVQRIEGAGNWGCDLNSFAGDTRRYELRLSQSRFFSVANSKIPAQSKTRDDKVDEEPKHILSLLQDESAHPIGSLSPVNIKESEDALGHELDEVSHPDTNVIHTPCEVFYFS